MDLVLAALHCEGVANSAITRQWEGAHESWSKNKEIRTGNGGFAPSITPYVWSWLYLTPHLDVSDCMLGPAVCVMSGPIRGCAIGDCTEPGMAP